MIPAISVGVQHHPARAGGLAPLLEALEPLDVEVVADPEPDAVEKVAWRSYRRALETTPPWASHRLVVQDDALPCRSFPAALERLLAAVPDRLLVLCVCGEPSESARAVDSARWAGKTLVELGVARWVPVVATVWPVELIGPTLAYVDEQRANRAWPSAFLADDEIVRRVAQALRLRPVATVPSIVEHPDLVASVIGRRRPMGGKNRARVAHFFVPDDVDAAAIDWAL